MTIGLILLAAVAVFLFFGGSERFFSKLGIPSKAAFLIVLALVLGTVIPTLSFGSALTVNLGGFLIPLAIMAVFLFRCDSMGERLKALLSIAAVAAVCVAVRMLIPGTSAGLAVTISVVTGFVGAAVACMVAGTRVSALAGVVGGVVLGDIVTSLAYRFFIDGSIVSLGTAGAFDSVIIGVVFAVIIAETLSAVKRHSRVSVHSEPQAGMTEAGSDNADVEKAAPVYHFNEEDYEEYFNDDID